MNENKSLGYSVIVSQEVYDSMKLEIANLKSNTGFYELEKEIAALRAKNEFIEKEINAYHSSFRNKFLLTIPINRIRSHTYAFLSSLLFTSKKNKESFSDDIEFNLNTIQRAMDTEEKFINKLLSIINS